MGEISSVNSSITMDSTISFSNQVFSRRAELLVPVTTKEEEEENQSFIRVNAMFLGFLVGLFMQMSALGANFIVDLLPRHYTGNGGNEALGFSIVWSSITSGFGVMILIILRLLISYSNKSTETCLLQVELYFAAGSLVAVTLAWAVTDFVVGYDGHLSYSLYTLAGALIWSRAVSIIARPATVEVENMDNLNLTVPLIEKEIEITENSRSRYKIHSLILGALVGFFIQTSSFGANFVFQHMSGGQSKNYLFFSFFWSLISSALSVAVLVLVCRILRKQSNDRSTVWILECYFSVGALLAVHASWFATKAFMGIQTSPFIIVLALIWAKTIHVYYDQLINKNKEDAQKYIGKEDSSILAV